jgi:hypothetical protein
MNDPYKPSECQLSGCDDGIFDVHVAARALGRMLVTGQNGVVGMMIKVLDRLLAARK